MKFRLMLACSEESNTVFSAGCTAFKTGHPLLVEMAVGGLQAEMVLPGCSKLYSGIVKTRALLSLWEAQDASEKNRKTVLPHKAVQLPPPPPLPQWSVLFWKHCAPVTLGGFLPPQAECRKWGTLLFPCKGAKSAPLPQEQWGWSNFFVCLHQLCSGHRWLLCCYYPELRNLLMLFVFFKHSPVEGISRRDRRANYPTSLLPDFLSD